MALYRNKGDGTFEDRTEAAGLAEQLGGLDCVQTDYNNDGHLDIFIPRGAWLPTPIRPSLLRNNGDGTFTDVTEKAGLLAARSTPTPPRWADYDNDGFLDLFVCCERQPVPALPQPGRRHVRGGRRQGRPRAATSAAWKGCTWIDFDNDGYPDLFLNNLLAAAPSSSTTTATARSPTSPSQMGIDGPEQASRAGPGTTTTTAGSTSSPPATTASARHARGRRQGSACGQPHDPGNNRLYRNLGGKGFQDVTQGGRPRLVFATMGSNFGDFDNDGFLDFYLGTGDPTSPRWSPTACSRTSAASASPRSPPRPAPATCRRGTASPAATGTATATVDIFIEMGGALPGDKYHNVLFQNPGQGNNWLTVKLVGKKTNRAAHRRPHQGRDRGRASR